MTNSRTLREEANELVAMGYMVLGQTSKTYPPRGATGYAAPWENKYFGEEKPAFLAIRFNEETFGIDIDTDLKSGHATEDMESLAELWEDFRAEFRLSLVRTGANTNNGAGIYHFRLGDGLTEGDIAQINVANLDILRKSHRFAVVRGTPQRKRLRGEST